jgi:hypothetical protein
MPRQAKELIEEAQRHRLSPPRILSIQPSETSYGYLSWLVTFDDLRQGSTVKPELAKECYRLMELHVPVEIQRSKMGYGYALVSIKEVPE